MSVTKDPVVAFLTRTGAPQAVWQTLAISVGGRSAVGVDAAELDVPLSSACAVVLVAEGEEWTAAARIREIRSDGAAAVAVAGRAKDHRVAVATLHAGATDYFALPDDTELLRSWLAARVASWRTSRSVDRLLAEEKRRHEFEGIIGHSGPTQAAIARASLAASRASTPVLIRGAAGTGKDLLARTIHYNGPRAAKPFLRFYASAYAPEQVGMELFGRAEGGGSTGRTGAIEGAQGGTLYIDEVAALPTSVQARVLAWLQEGRIRRVGGDHDVTVDVRLIVGTKAELVAMIGAGRFREDLHRLLNVMSIDLPALHSRGDDVILLAFHFLDRFGEEHGVGRLNIDPDLRQQMLAYEWPGNVRELRESIERAVLFGEGVIRAEDLFETGAPIRATPHPVYDDSWDDASPVEEPAAGGSPGADTPADMQPAGAEPAPDDEEPAPDAEPAALPFPAPMDEIEKAAAQAMVEREGGNKSAAAAALQISRSRLYRLLGED
jgi:DNA-binding NtrC family response regulator